MARANILAAQQQREGSTNIIISHEAKIIPTSVFGKFVKETLKKRCFMAFYKRFK